MMTYPHLLTSGLSDFFFPYVSNNCTTEGGGEAILIPSHPNYTLLLNIKQTALELSLK